MAGDRRVSIAGQQGREGSSTESARGDPGYRRRWSGSPTAEFTPTRPTLGMTAALLSPAIAWQISACWTADDHLQGIPGNQLSGPHRARGGMHPRYGVSDLKRGEPVLITAHQPGIPCAAFWALMLHGADGPSRRGRH